MLKRIGAIVGGVVLALGFVVTVATPAQAARADCWYGYVCLWDNGDYTGTIHRIPASPLGYCYNIPAGSGFNDRAESFYNRLATRHVQFYRDRDCTGHLQHRQSDCFTGPHPGQTWGQFQFTSHLHCLHSATHDANSTTSVFFNTG